MLRALFTVVALLLPTALLAQVDGKAGDRRGDSAIVIIGVVDPSGGGGGSREPGEENWTGSFHLIAWRIEGTEEISERELRIEIPDQTEQSLNTWARIFPARSLVRFTVREPVVPGEYVDRAVLRAPLPPKPDPQITAIAHAMLNPPPFVDEELGTFTPHDRFPNWFDQQRQWLGTKVSVTLHIDTPASANLDQLGDAAATLNALEQDASSWDERMRKAIVDEYYTLWVETWREDQPMISRKTFGKRFVPDGASFYRDGAFRFYFRDGGLFWGHWMEVSGSLEEGVTEVSMVG